MIDLIKNYHHYAIAICAIVFLYFLVIRVVIKKEKRGFLFRSLCIIAVVFPVWILLYGKMSSYCNQRIKDRFHYLLSGISFLPIFGLLCVRLIGNSGFADVSAFDDLVYPRADIVFLSDTVSLAGFVNISGVPVPCVLPMFRNDGVANMFLLAIHWIVLCGVPFVLCHSMLEVADISKRIRYALLQYEPFKKAGDLKVQRINGSTYDVSSKAFVRHSGIYEVKENIENAMGGDLIILKIIKIKNGLFRIELGKLDIVNDKEGRSVSNAKFSDYKFLKTGTSADSVNIPIGSISTADGEKETVLVNLMTYAHWGLIGDSGSGKTTLVRSIIGAILSTDYQTNLIICDAPKGGTGFKSLTKDQDKIDTMPENFMPDLNRAEREAAYSLTLPDLDNVTLIDSYSAFHSMIEQVEIEAEWRSKYLLSKYGFDSIYGYELAYPEAEKLSRYFIVIDEYMLMKIKAQSDKKVASDLARLDALVSLTRYVKIHLIFLGQKGTVEYFSSTREQLFMIGLGLHGNESEYVMKVRVSLPSHKGVFGYRIGDDNRELGLACAANLPMPDLAKIVSGANERLSGMNRMRSLQFKNACNCELPAEIMETVAIRQHEFLKFRGSV